MANKNKIILGLAVLALIFVLIVFFQDQNKTKVSSVENQPAINTDVNTDAPVNTVGQEMPDGSFLVVPTTASSTAEQNATVDMKVIKPLTAQLDVMPSADSAPKQEKVELSEVPAAAIKLAVSAAGFTPNEITVQTGQKVILSLTASDETPHVLAFPGTPLRALTMTVLGGETKMMEFVAPEAGVYNFRDNIPSYRENTGRLIIK